MQKSRRDFWRFINKSSVEVATVAADRIAADLKNSLPDGLLSEDALRGVAKAMVMRAIPDVIPIEFARDAFAWCGGRNSKTRAARARLWEFASLRDDGIGHGDYAAMGREFRCSRQVVWYAAQSLPSAFRRILRRRL